MAVKESEFYYGAVLTRLFSAKKDLKISHFPNDSNCAFVLNGSVGLYIKYSTKRITPWRFSFVKKHQDDIRHMKDLCKKVFLILVCRDNGIAAIEFEDLKKVLDHHHEEVEWVSASRLRREKYTIKGSDGKLKFKIGENAFPSQVIESL